LAGAYQELAASHAEATALRDGILPEAERAFTAARDAFRQGLLRLTDVLDTERTLFELRGRQVDALARYHAAVADMEALLGGPLAAPTPGDER
jgi:cobalt-zinc-cadmium efflux system outer membrane protein